LAIGSDAATGRSGNGAGYVLTLSCPDRPGIVHAVASYLIEHGGNIWESQQFDDREGGLFFMRVHFEAPVGKGVETGETPVGGGGERGGSGEAPDAVEILRRDFADVASAFSMSWRLLEDRARQRVLIMVSKYGHCLNDLLYRAATGRLNIDIPAVVSNHPDLGVMADNYDIPFHHIPVTPDTKRQAEAALVNLIDELGIDLVVLARYMQVLSVDLCKRLEGRAINIHHSMLPSFKGGRPYNQAHDRGVKLVGATAHYVTPDLDEGPIIEQEVARVDHRMTAEDVTAAGRDTECIALARAVQWHTENRVLLYGHRTVVFH
jgi:formyltetrahydrofolate deformylase